MILRRAAPSSARSTRIRRAPIAARLGAGFIALAAAAATACASQQGFDTQRLPDGSINLKCRGPLGQCLANADAICHGNTYEVVRARDQRDRYGPANGTSQVEVRSSEATVRCSSPLHPLNPKAGTVESANGWTLKRGGSDEGVDGNGIPAGVKDETRPGTAGLTPVTARVCVPGTTQACVGPGKCEGGQSCLPDGSAFGPCDCGTIGAPIQAPAGNAGTSGNAGAAEGPGGTPPVAPSSTKGKRGAGGTAPAVPGAAPPASPLK
jgi:hypothetical protein